MVSLFGGRPGPAGIWLFVFPADKCVSAVHFQLLIDVLDVVLDRFYGNIEPDGYFFVCEPLLNGCGNLRLARGKLFPEVRRVPGVEILDHHAGNSRRHRCTTLVQRQNGFFNLQQRCLLEQVARSAIAQRLEHPVSVVIYRQHNHLALWRMLFDTLNTFDARLAWEADVGKHNVQVNRFFPLFKKSSYRMRGEQTGKTRLAIKKVNQRGPNLFVVFDNA